MGKYQAHRDCTICVSFTRFQPDGFQFPILPVNFLFVLVIALKTVQTPPAAQSVSTSSISRSSVLALDSSSVPVNSGGDKEGFIQPPPHCNLWSRNYRIKIYPIQGQVSWRVSPASEKQFQDHLMNFLKLSPLTTQPAELSSSHWGPLGPVKIWIIYWAVRAEQVSVSERRSVSITGYFKPNGKVSWFSFHWISFKFKFWHFTNQGAAAPWRSQD